MACVPSTIFTLSSCLSRSFFLPFIILIDPRITTSVDYINSRLNFATHPSFIHPSIHHVLFCPTTVDVAIWYEDVAEIPRGQLVIGTKMCKPKHVAVLLRTTSRGPARRTFPATSITQLKLPRERTHQTIRPVPPITGPSNL
jgi:hypothetical protein